MIVINASNVSKSYGPNKALDNFSLQVEEGQVFALLGKNGAGKTTFIKGLLNLVSVDAGELSLFGTNVTETKARSQVSYLPEKFGFFPYYHLAGICELFGKMRNLKGPELKEQIDKQLSLVGLEGLENKKVKECSKGQLQRLGVAVSLMGNPRLLILDEPFSGLDPIGIKDLMILFSQLQKEGRTLFINSHGLDSMEKVCDSFAIVNHGKLIATGKVKEEIGQGSLLDYFYEKVGKGSVHEL